METILMGLYTKHSMVRNIALVICDYFKTDWETISKKGRKREIVEMRYIFFYFVKKHTKLSLSEIGGFTDQDHSTVFHGLKTLSGFIGTNKKITTNINELEERIRKMISETHLKPTLLDIIESLFVRGYSMEIRVILKEGSVFFTNNNVVGNNGQSFSFPESVAEMRDMLDTLLIKHPDNKKEGAV